jgi:hydroxymethylbilane synthase
MRIRIGTRASKLALWQARHVQALLAGDGVESDLVEVTTTGDVVQDRPLHQVKAVGIFTKALDDALLEGRADIAVHSAKDLPSTLVDGLDLLALLKREDPRDVLLAMGPEVNLENFSRTWIIGTSSVRRAAFLRHYFQHLDIRDIRGNVDTRVAKLAAGDYDGIVLAMAGVKRMGLQQYIVQKLNPATFTPAVGQGAIAVVGRRGAPQREALRQRLNHRMTEIAVTAERAFLRKLGGGCSIPAFGLATVVGETVSLTAGLATESGSHLQRYTFEGPVAEAAAIGARLGQQVLDQVEA